MSRDVAFVANTNCYYHENIGMRCDFEQCSQDTKVYEDGGKCVKVISDWCLSQHYDSTSTAHSQSDDNVHVDVGKRCDTKSVEYVEKRENTHVTGAHSKDADESPAGMLENSDNSNAEEYTDITEDASKVMAGNDLLQPKQNIFGDLGVIKVIHQSGSDIDSDINDECSNDADYDDGDVEIVESLRHDPIDNLIVGDDDDDDNSDNFSSSQHSSPGLAHNCISMKKRKVEREGDDLRIFIGDDWQHEERKRKRSISEHEHRHRDHRKQLAGESSNRSSRRRRRASHNHSVDSAMRTKDPSERDFHIIYKKHKRSHSHEKLKHRTLHKEGGDRKSRKKCAPRDKEQMSSLPRDGKKQRSSLPRDGKKHSLAISSKGSCHRPLKNLSVEYDTYSDDVEQHGSKTVETLEADNVRCFRDWSDIRDSHIQHQTSPMEDSPGEHLSDNETSKLSEKKRHVEHDDWMNRETSLDGLMGYKKKRGHKTHQRKHGHRISRSCQYKGPSLSVSPKTVMDVNDGSGDVCNSSNEGNIHRHKRHKHSIHKRKHRKKKLAKEVDITRKSSKKQKYSHKAFSVHTFLNKNKSENGRVNKSKSNRKHGCEVILVSPEENDDGISKVCLDENEDKQYDVCVNSYLDNILREIQELNPGDIPIPKGKYPHDDIAEHTVVPDEGKIKFKVKKLKHSHDLNSISKINMVNLSKVEQKVADSDSVEIHKFDFETVHKVDCCDEKNHAEEKLDYVLDKQFQIGHTPQHESHMQAVLTDYLADKRIEVKNSTQTENFTLNPVSQQLQPPKKGEIKHSVDPAKSTLAEASLWDCGGVQRVTLIEQACKCLPDVKQTRPLEHPVQSPVGVLQSSPPEKSNKHCDAQQLLHAEQPTKHLVNDQQPSLFDKSTKYPVDPQRPPLFEDLTKHPAVAQKPHLTEQSTRSGPDVQQPREEDNESSKHAADVQELSLVEWTTSHAVDAKQDPVVENSSKRIVDAQQILLNEQSMKHLVDAHAPALIEQWPEISVDAQQKTPHIEPSDKQAIDAENQQPTPIEQSSIQSNDAQEKTQLVEQSVEHSIDAKKVSIFEESIAKAVGSEQPSPMEEVTSTADGHQPVSSERTVKCPVKPLHRPPLPPKEALLPTPVRHRAVLEGCRFNPLYRTDSVVHEGNGLVRPLAPPPLPPLPNFIPAKQLPRGGCRVMPLSCSTHLSSTTDLQVHPMMFPHVQCMLNPILVSQPSLDAGPLQLQTATADNDSLPVHIQLPFNGGLPPQGFRDPLLHEGFSKNNLINSIGGNPQVMSPGLFASLSSCNPDGMCAHESPAFQKHGLGDLKIVTSSSSPVLKQFGACSLEALRTHKKDATNTFDVFSDIPETVNQGDSNNQLAARLCMSQNLSNTKIPPPFWPADIWLSDCQKGVSVKEMKVSEDSMQLMDMDMSPFCNDDACELQLPLSTNGQSLAIAGDVISRQRNKTINLMPKRQSSYIVENISYDDMYNSRSHLSQKNSLDISVSGTRVRIGDIINASPEEQSSHVMDKVTSASATKSINRSSKGPPNITSRDIYGKIDGYVDRLSEKQLFTGADNVTDSRSSQNVNKLSQHATPLQAAILKLTNQSTTDEEELTSAVELNSKEKVRSLYYSFAVLILFYFFTEKHLHCM